MNKAYEMTIAGCRRALPICPVNESLSIGAFVILSFPLRTGLETVSKWMMGLLFVLMVFLAVHSLFLDGAREGLTFYLLPDFSKFTSATVVAAMNQAFFSLSIGIGKRIGQRHRFGYGRGRLGRFDYLPGLLYVRRQTDSRSEPDFRSPPDHLP